MVGDQHSFEEFVRARTAALSRVAYLLTGDHHLAEDLVQQAFLRVADRWASLVARGDPDAYVRRVLYSQHISWWRRRERPTAQYEAPREATTDPGDTIVVAMAVRRALARLGRGQRAVLILRYFEDLSERRTSEILGISVGTVKSQARDGLARLRELAPELSTLTKVET